MDKKKVKGIRPEERLRWVVRGRELSLKRQCELAGIARSTVYYEPRKVDAVHLEIMKEIDRLYTAHPDKGARRISEDLKESGFPVGRELAASLMRTMGLAAVYRKPRLSQPDRENKVYPYLLRGVEITMVNQVWSTDITYIHMKNGFLYLTAVIDWRSRYVLSWRLSNSLDVSFCCEVVEEALEKGRPEIFNTDQGAQYTSREFIQVLKRAGVQISMDGIGRALDNVFVERLWRTVKYEDIYIKDYENGRELYEGLKQYFLYYNKERKHSSLEYRTPLFVYEGGEISLVEKLHEIIP